MLSTMKPERDSTSMINRDSFPSRRQRRKSSLLSRRNSMNWFRSSMYVGPSSTWITETRRLTASEARMACAAGRLKPSGSKSRRTELGPPGCGRPVSWRTPAARSRTRSSAPSMKTSTSRTSTESRSWGSSGTPVLATRFTAASSSSQHRTKCACRCSRLSRRREAGRRLLTALRRWSRSAIVKFAVSQALEQGSSSSCISRAGCRTQSRRYSWRCSKESGGSSMCTSRRQERSMASSIWFR
mmetsp:Transcript_39061/g.116688  ORF Transcript_39061/g.116688 Transcript_39061/m.116688 type:complete len:242 (+) Transcript_39061:1165-1890(+)